MNAYEAALADLVEDIREVDGNHDLGAGELAEELIRLGWTKVDYVTRYPVDYHPGRPVKFLDPQRGDWVDAVVSGSVGNTVQVDTDRGPRTSGSPRTIQPVY